MHHLAIANEHHNRRVAPERMQLPWYVMQTKPRDERRVIQHLALRVADVETFLPRIEITRRRAGRRVVSLQPLFPSYVFARFWMNPSTWNAVRWTPGVRRILSEGGGVPAEVPMGLITAIRERMQTLGFIRIGMNLSPGDRVRVASGPLIGLNGIFERATSRRDRVRVLLEILGTVRPLEVEVFDLERL